MKSSNLEMLPLAVIARSGEELFDLDGATEWYRLTFRDDNYWEDSPPRGGEHGVLPGAWPNPVGFKRR